VLTPKFGKSTVFAIKLPICQNYVEIGLYGQDLAPDRARYVKCTKLSLQELEILEISRS
jgi:hypothetical protein